MNMLTPKDVAEAKELLKKKIKKFKCPMCARANFNLYLGVVHLSVGDARNIIPGHVFTAIPVICAECGFIQLHSVRELIKKDVTE
jgi:hypothetical protein